MNYNVKHVQLQKQLRRFIQLTTKYRLVQGRKAVCEPSYQLHEVFETTDLFW